MSNYDIDSFLDFSEASTPTPAMAPHLALPQTFNGPSHQYDLHPQQTGLLPSPRVPSLSPEFDSMFLFPEQVSGFVDEDEDIDVLAGIKEKKKSSASNTDPETELKIRQILEDVKRRAMSTTDTVQSQQPLPQLQRMKKDEDDMDEDERLLASEEGKKLSSKERRQLRNKVSARAFRSRRKEYISQLETEVNNKSTENSELREKLRSVEAENQSLRDLTKMLLASPQFSQFLDQLHPVTQAPQPPAPAPTQQETVAVHRASIPEIQVSEPEFQVPSYIPPYNGYQQRKDTNPNQLQGVEDWPLAYTSAGQWGSQMVFAAEISTPELDLEDLAGKDWMCTDGFRPLEKEVVNEDVDANGQFIFNVFEDELEQVPDYLFDHFQIHEKEEDTTEEPATVELPLGLDQLFTQLEEHFTQPETETCRDAELSRRTLETLERTYRRVGVVCGA